MKVVILDDHPLAREGIINILSRKDKAPECIGASNINEALDAVEKENIDIIMLDLRLHNENGLDVVAGVKKLRPEIKFVIISSEISHQDFDKAEQLGVNGYILKNALPEDIAYVFDLVLRGKKYYDPEIISDYKEHMVDKKIIDTLTDRERDVLFEVGKGISNEEIASKLYISINTVKKHITSILDKLEMKRRTQLVLFVKELETPE